MYIINVSNVSNNESPISLLILATMCAGFPFPVNYRCVQVESSSHQEAAIQGGGVWQVANRTETPPGSSLEMR